MESSFQDWESEYTDTEHRCEAPELQVLVTGGERVCKHPGHDSGRHGSPWRSKPFAGSIQRGEWRSKSSALNSLPWAGEDPALTWTGSI